MCHFSVLQCVTVIHSVCHSDDFERVVFGQGLILKSENEYHFLPVHVLYLSLSLMHIKLVTFIHIAICRIEMFCHREWQLRL